MIFLVERTKAGIAGLDKALNGGIPQKNIVLVSGGAGTGKSTLCLQYLYNGAKQFGEKGLYLSTEQTRQELFKTALSFGMDLESLEKQNLIKIVFFDVVETDNFLQKIYDLYVAFKPKRIVLDSLTTFTDSLMVSGVKEETAFSLVQIAESVSPVPRTEKVIAKTLLYHLFKKLRLFDATIMLTSELLQESKSLSADEVSEFIADGVIILYYLGIGASDSRTIQIRKLRYSNHEKDSVPYSIGDKGIEIISGTKF